MNFEGNENSVTCFGPWGGQNGARWDDGVYDGVRQVVIYHGASIDSIQLEYDKGGFSILSGKHGGTGGIKTNKVKVDFPEEYLVSISGYYGSLVEDGPLLVRSIGLETNKKKYGPFGIQQGTFFSTPKAGGNVVGFHGRSSWYLDSIGVHIKPQLQRNVSTSLTIPQPYPINESPNKIIKGQLNDFPAVPCNKVGKIEVVNGAFYRNKVPDNSDVVPYNNVGTITTTQAVLSPEAARNPKLQAVSYGPWGGNGGTMFDDGVYTGVREVHLTRYGGLVSIQVCYDMKGQAIWGNKNGGSGGIRLDKVAFDYPSEVLTHLTGYYGSTIFRGPIVIKSVTLYTNKMKYGPFGEEQGIPFTCGSAGSGVIVGFHGRKGWFIDSIGVHVSPPRSISSAAPPLVIERIASLIPVKDPAAPVTMVRKPDAPMMLRTAPLTGLASPPIMKEQNQFVSGPWGGEGGQGWNDGVFSGIKKIYLTKGEAICCIQTEYDRNGESFWSVRRGGGSQGSSHTIKFDYPQEVLLSVCGYHDSLTGDASKSVIKSLAFFTNKGKYGPYGEETGQFFTSDKMEGRIVGFHGRCGCYLNAIGVHTQQWSNNQDMPGLGQLGNRGGTAKRIINKIFN